MERDTKIKMRERISSEKEERSKKKLQGNKMISKLRKKVRKTPILTLLKTQSSPKRKKRALPLPTSRQPLVSQAIKSTSAIH